jgi:hypothetical protein
LSNQFFIGEKHIPLNRVGKCPNATYASSNAELTRNSSDCSYLQTGYRKSAAGARAIVYWMPWGWWKWIIEYGTTQSDFPGRKLLWIEKLRGSR